MSDTPQLLALMQKTREMKAYDCVKEFESLARKLEKENIALRAWKESALAVERELNAQTTAKLLGARLGESCHKVIAEKVPQLVAENAKLREVLNRLGYDETGRVLFQK